MNDLSDEDFKRLYTFMQEKFGIDLKRKKPLIVSRLSSILESRGYTDFHDYVNDIIQKQDQDMMTTLLNKLTTNYTYFMREESHFDYLENVVMPQLAETGTLVSWLRIFLKMSYPRRKTPSIFWKAWKSFQRAGKTSILFPLKTDITP